MYVLKVAVVLEHFVVAGGYMDELRHEQGFYIDQIVAYANLQIKEEDAGRVRCATTKSLDRVFKFIAVKESIPVTKVYPAIRYIGYNSRYHNMKTNLLDPLYSLGDAVSKCINTADVDMIDFATEDSVIFENTVTSLYRMKKDAISITMKDADQYGIKVADVNMYNVLEGLDVLMSNEPDYILLRDKPLFEYPMATFDSIKRLIMFKTIGLNALLK